MSGIVGIVNLNGASVDPRLLQRMTDFLAFRGPDAMATWIDGNVGFGHTLLKTTFEAEHEHQPFTLDGKVWIVADARIDAQAELIEELRQRGVLECGSLLPLSSVPVPPPPTGVTPLVEPDREQAREVKAAASCRTPNGGAPVTDVELILRAYHAWGENCVEHLLGDFAFGIWDSARQHLFCARDHMGVKPFYYAHIGQLVVFSNTLDCVRLHPAVSDKLNDLAIADFLILEGNQDPATTSFADIQRLAPAHRVMWSSAGMRLSRYWTLPIDEPIFYRRAGDYVDRFKELLRQAITDRLRTKKVGILMSGGLDSPTLAATTCDLLRERYGNADLKAFTQVASRGPDERYYAGLVASRLGIPIHFHEETEPVDLNWERKQAYTPEPVGSPWGQPAWQESFREFGIYSRVFFYGEGPDNALRFEWRPYFRYLLGQCRGGTGVPPVVNHGQDGRAIWYWRLVLAFFSVTAHGPIPFWGRIPRRIKELRCGWELDRNFPDFLNPTLESRLRLRARWEAFQRPLTSTHPVRPRGYASMLVPLWQAIFESFDAGRTGAPLELRHPYVDLRMLRFLLAVPALPWCRSKHLLRRAMRDVLPQQVLSRGKKGVPIGPGLKGLTQLAAFPFVPASELSYYVSLISHQRTTNENIWDFGDSLRVRSLNHWLQNSRKRLNITQLEDPDNEPFSESADISFTEKVVRKALPPNLR